MKFGSGRACRLKSLKRWAGLCVLLAAALLLWHDPFLLLWWPQRPAEESNGVLPLDMATDSVDDMYYGCRSEAASMIHLFGVFEWHVNRNFSLAWALTERRARKPAHKHLQEDHAVAMYMYTKYRTIQQDFNEAVKTGKQKYNTHRFMYHYMYFHLTDAIQVLRHNKTPCRTTYLRTWEQFDHNVVNTDVRFGVFSLVASSKQSFDFKGNVSCFEILSCFGADVTYYSAVKQKGQVLIPPYEVFTVTDVLTDNPWCRVVYKLQSTKAPRVDLNCRMSQRQKRKMFYSVSTLWNSASRVGTMLPFLIPLIIISLVLIERRQKCFVAAVLGALMLLMVLEVKAME